MTFAREAWPFVLPFAVLAAALFYFRQPAWGALAAALALGVLLFFRDPARSFTGPANILVAPADGVITRIDRIEDPAVADGEMLRIVTFLSAFDVHIQRCPTDGVVVASSLQPGRKVAAFREDAGEVNENFLTVIRRVNGEHIGIRQIAGLMARRVVSHLGKDQSVERGQHLGLIKFGSRVDLMVPTNYEILVTKGDRLRNGETPVAKPRAETNASSDSAVD